MFLERFKFKSLALVFPLIACLAFVDLSTCCLSNNYQTQSSTKVIPTEALKGKCFFSYGKLAPKLRFLSILTTNFEGLPKKGSDLK